MNNDSMMGFTTYKNSMETISTLTFEETKKFLNRVYISSLVRERQHTENTKMSIYDALNIYIKRNSIVGDEITYIEAEYICDHDEPPQIPPYISLNIEYGKPFNGKMFEDEEAQTTCSSIFKVKILPKLQIIIEPPLHNAIDMPLKINNFIDRLNIIHEIIDKTSVFYDIISDDKENSNLQFIKGPNRKKRNDIYGEFMEIIIPYIKKHAINLLELTERVRMKYQKYHIGKVKSACYAFLIIGRFNKICDIDVPYDIVKLIAKYVWKSRYNNEIWKTPIKEKQNNERMCLEEDYSYMEWYQHPNMLPDFQGLHFQQYQYFDEDTF